MSVYISNASEWPSAGMSGRSRGGGNAWAHLAADTRVELHTFASRLGLKRRHFNDSGYPHYQLTLGTWGKAQRMGATPVTRHELLAIARACGSVSGGLISRL